MPIDLLAIPGIGPRPPSLIGTELGISTVEAWKRREDGRLATLRGWAKKAADSICATSEPRFNEHPPHAIGQALPTAETVIARPALKRDMTASLS